MKKNKKSFPLKPALLLSASALLLLGSTIGSTRAALTYYSENYSAQIEMSAIDVTLLENGKAVEGDGLLKDMLGKDGKLTPGKKYEEKISVQNSGNIDTFVRVVLTKSWQDEAGQKDTTLSPDLIELNLTGNGWEQANVESSPERIVLYYTQALAPGESAPELSDAIRIDNVIAEKVTKKVEGNTIRYVYDYNGYSFSLDAEVHAVQTHNAKEAIKSAWGVDVNVSSDETSISLQ